MQSIVRGWQRSGIEGGTATSRETIFLLTWEIAMRMRLSCDRVGSDSSSAMFGARPQGLTGVINCHLNRLARIEREPA